MAPLLQVNNLSKRFGSLTALNNVSFDVFAGEVIGLAGRSGAGKSTLSDLVSGRYAPSSGELLFEDEPLLWPFDARTLGIEIIHQEPALSENLDITQNIFLGNELKKRLWPLWLQVPDTYEMEKVAARIIVKMEAELGPLEQLVANLTIEQRQLVAIAQAVVRAPKLLFIDDATAQLGYPFQQRLLSLIRDWQQQGTTVIFSSNNLEHLFAVSDKLITLRRGELVAEHRADEVSREEVVAELVGGSSNEQMTPAIWALDNYYRAREQADRLRYQQTLLERDLVEQGSINQGLVEQLAAQVGSLDQANVALQDAQRRLLTEREQERKHLARELHDQVIQDLLSVNYELERLEGQDTSHGSTAAGLAASGLAASEFAANELADIRSNIRNLVVDVRRICGNLRPPTIDSLGLGAALQSHANDWSERTQIPVTLDLDTNLRRLPEAIELSIFRIIQEGLNNIGKHAKAKHVDIYLKHTSPRMLMLSVTDDGEGLDEGFDLSALAAQGHYGLLGISERVALLGGRLSIQNHPRGWCLATCRDSSC